MVFSVITYFPATSGINSGWPNLSAPKVLINSCPAFDTRKSAKAMAPIELTFGHFSGLTVMI
jgi:hypothetical protein